MTDEAFEQDLDAVIARAREAGVAGAMCILAAGDAREAARSTEVRAAWPHVVFSTGVHPHAAGTYTERADAAGRIAREYATRVEARGIGEIGLDYHYDFAPRDTQRDVFSAQIAVALDMDLPIVIHTREATDDTFAILKEAGRGAVRGVFHCFTGDSAMARRALDIGFSISLAGIVSFPKAQALRDAARLVPADRLLIETDSPYLAPVPHRGRRNEPAFVARVLETLAEIRSEPRATLEAQTTANFERLFGPIRATTSGEATA